MSLYLRDPHVEPIAIPTYPRRRTRSYLAPHFFFGASKPRAGEPRYADFFAADSVVSALVDQAS